VISLCFKDYFKELIVFFSGHILGFSSSFSSRIQPMMQGQQRLRDKGVMPTIAHVKPTSLYQTSPAAPPVVSSSQG
jgi:hypothetical protein